jgi:hypothetical protein
MSNIGHPIHIHAYMLSSIVAPSNAGSSTSVRHEIFSSANLFTMTCAILSKFSVARARMVGPAPDKHIPSSPGCDFGVTEARISGNPGIYALEKNNNMEVEEVPNVFGRVGGLGLALRDISIQGPGENG